MTQNKPRYTEKPNGKFVYKIDKQTFKVSIYFNQNSKETLQDKLLRAILADQAKGDIIYGK